MRITIDRFEHEFAVAELPDGSICNVPQALFPNAAEGDVFIIAKDEGERAKRQKRVQDKFDQLKR